VWGVSFLLLHLPTCLHGTHSMPTCSALGLHSEELRTQPVAQAARLSKSRKGAARTMAAPSLEGGGRPPAEHFPRCFSLFPQTS
jgi:hypothetical protein